MYSVALSGLSFVNALVPGVNTPVCGLSRLRRFSPDSNNFQNYLYFVSPRSTEEKPQSCAVLCDLLWQSDMSLTDRTKSDLRKMLIYNRDSI